MKLKHIMLLVFIIAVAHLYAYMLLTYEVQPGDTLYEIARRFDVHISTILDFNDIENPRLLRVGEQLIIPQPDGLLYEVKKDDTLTYIAKLFFTPLEPLLKANNLTRDSWVFPGQKIFIPASIINVFAYEPIEKPLRWPVYGYISSYYGMRIHPITGQRKFHTGLDIAAPEGAPIFAAGSGTVVFAGFDKGYGYMVEIMHDDGETVTRYAHMSHISVYVGQHVYAGDLLGRVGSTGLATGPHVHFEVRRLAADGKSYPRDPIAFLPTRDLIYYVREYKHDGTQSGGK
ncbi:M23 family metallopeptidase [Kosmotoga sp.]|uniref:M23 family metallopeptidase n=1 Tax=Kosmotoga sp. TaxID=1955248 RepID=UPI0024ABA8DD|nr:M23 family metallopeptidase [Kosmotoga sp.]MDI3524028.1 hypothetical protein [Kosmotoga sp.]MDK2954002.1 hypothetical protein [Kosmotoga sp.]